MAIHDPMGRAAQALPFRAHAIGKDFADVHPDHGANRDGEERDVGHQKPYQQTLMLCVKNTTATPPRQKVIPTAPISSSVLRPSLSIRDIPTACDQIHRANRDGLQTPETLLNPAIPKM